MTTWAEITTHQILHNYLAQAQNVEATQLTEELLQEAIDDIRAELRYDSQRREWLRLRREVHGF